MNHVRSVEHQLPLHSAVVCGSVEAVRLLLDYPYPSSSLVTFTDSVSNQTYQAGLEFNAQDAMGETPLHIACRNGHTEIVKLLVNYAVHVEVEKGQIVKTTSIGSLNAEHINESMTSDSSSEYDNNQSKPNSPSKGSLKNKTCIQSIYPVDVGILNSSGLSPYHVAIRHRRPNVLKILLESRGSPPSKMKMQDMDSSVLMYAHEQGSVAILDLLLAHGLKDVDNKVLASAFFARVSAHGSFI